MKIRTTAATMLASMTLLFVSGCSEEPAPVDPGPSAAQIAAQERRAALQAAFPGMEPADTRGALDAMRKNFTRSRTVHVETTTSDGDRTAPREVVLTPTGVYAKSWLSGAPVETITLDGHVGFVRGPVRFWTANGMERAAARDAGGVWVRTRAVADESQTLQQVRERLSEEFVTEWGGGFGEVELVEHRGEPAVLVNTGLGSVLGAGDPLLPVRYEFTRDGAVSTMTFAYEGIDPVTAPRRNVSLDAVVFQ